jgi:CheY-like chemotaxis protein
MGFSHPVLVVDDDYTIQAIISHILNEEGLTPVTCEDGEMALQMISALEFKLAIIDLTLPKVDGWKVAEKLIETSPNASIMFITSTVTAKSEKYRFDNFDHNDIDVFYKPILDREGFIEAVKSLLEVSIAKEID